MLSCKSNFLFQYSLMPEVKGVVSLWLSLQLLVVAERRTLGKAGGTHPTGMVSYLLIEIGCYDLFLEIHVYNRTTFGTNSWRTFGQCCKIPTFKQKL